MSIRYTDGDSVESKIWQLVKDQTELGSNTPIAQSEYESWPVKYHLCPERANLLRHLDFSNLKVLELGAGMGAMSRFLAESCAELTVVEGTQNRFNVLSQRLRDLKNWKGEVANIQDLVPRPEFDVVCVIGVLEYSELYVSIPDGSKQTPFSRFLEQATAFLKPGGVLVLAIENQLGLKYWNASAEDHTARLFDGICGYTPQKTPRTFSRKNLKQMFRDAGLAQIDEYFPFPDYKVPSSVLSQEAIDAAPELSAEIAAGQNFENYANPNSKYFPDRLALQSVAGAGLLSDFSNSFLMVAGNDENSAVRAKLLRRQLVQREVGWHYANYRRIPAETIFSLPGGENQTGVRAAKRAIGKGRKPDFVFDLDGVGKLTWKPIAAEPIATGESVRTALARCAYFGEWSAYVTLLEDFISWSFAKWETKSGNSAGKSLSGKSLDALFLNATFANDFHFEVGKSAVEFTLFDLEWELSTEIPKSWFIFRNVFNLSRDAGLLTRQSLFSSLEQLYVKLCADFGVTADFAGEIHREALLQEASNGVPYARHVTLLRGLCQTEFGASQFPREPVAESRIRSELGRLQIENEKLHAEMSSLPHKITRKAAVLGEKMPALANALSTGVGGVYELGKKARQLSRELKPRVLQLGAGNSRGVELESDPNAFPEGFVWLRAQGDFSKVKTGTGFVEIHFNVDGGTPVTTRVAFSEISTDEASAFFKLGVKAERLSLDFGENVAFRLDKVELRGLTRSEAALRLLSPQISTMSREPLLLKKFLKRGAGYFRAQKARGLKTWLRQEAFQGFFPVVNEYSSWVENYDTFRPSDRAEIQNRLGSLKYAPLFSVVVPVYNTEERWLRAALDSVLAQVYPNWELCLADDCSPSPHVREILEEYRKKDPRIKVVYREKNGHISAASNSALDLARGEFTVLLDHDDELTPHALYMVALELNAHPDADLIYSDEDKIDVHGRRFDPHFKPDWSPDLFYSLNLVTHLSVFRSSLLREIGGFRIGYEGSQDYDLSLRVLEKTAPDRIRHIPFVLYHWRAIPGSVALASGEKQYAHEAARKAIRSHFERLGTEVEVKEGYASLHRVRYPMPEKRPAVTVIVCTRDRKALLETVVRGILEDTNYANLNLIVVDNQSREPETLAYFSEIQKDRRVKILKYDAAFNYAAMNNLAAKAAKTPLLAFLNNDLKVITKNWLDEMVRFALRPEIGAVGAKLYYPDDTIQHAGVYLGIGGIADHPHRGYPRNESGYIGRANVIQDFSAVSAACLVMRRDLFLEVGGFDEINLAVAYNDIDLCLKLREKDLRIVWTPYAQFYHFESASRGSDQTGDNLARFHTEIAYMKKRWGKVLETDPYYNPNFTNRRTDFSLAFPPRVEKPWKIAMVELPPHGKNKKRVDDRKSSLRPTLSS